MELMTARTFRAQKNVRQLTMLTAYDALFARWLDQAGVDAILVGDSLGPVMLGYADTTRVTLDDMEHHVRAAAAGTSRSLLVADLPFLSGHLGIHRLVEDAGRLIRAGARAVKLEGGAQQVPAVRALTAAGIPVMGHLGLTPQSIHVLGSYGVRGREDEEARTILEDALALEEAGAFSLVLECVPDALAAQVRRNTRVPVIGIGSGTGCDGQVLVLWDMLGLNPGHVPGFVHPCGNLGDALTGAVKEFLDRTHKEGPLREENHESN